LYTGSEKLLSANITDIMQTAYIEYSMSVIIAAPFRTPATA